MESMTLKPQRFPVLFSLGVTSRRWNSCYHIGKPILCVYEKLDQESSMPRMLGRVWGINRNVLIFIGLENI